MLKFINRHDLLIGFTVFQRRTQSVCLQLKPATGRVCSGFLFALMSPNLRRGARRPKSGQQHKPRIGAPPRNVGDRLMNFNSSDVQFVAFTAIVTGKLVRWIPQEGFTR